MAANTSLLPEADRAAYCWRVLGEVDEDVSLS